MIDPTKVTNYDRTYEELQEFLLFSVCVAGKNADQQAAKLDELLKRRGVFSPFGWINRLISIGRLEEQLKIVKLGKYKLLKESFTAIVDQLLGMDLKDVSREKLASLPGVGMKTASFFLLHSFPDMRIAVLDTYALAHIRQCLPGIKVPTSSPQSPNIYRLWETVWIGLVRKDPDYDKKSLAEIDLELWNHYSLKHRRNGNNGNQLPTQTKRPDPEDLASTGVPDGSRRATAGAV